MITATVGVVLGLAGSLILTRFLRSMLYEVGCADPLQVAAQGLEAVQDHALGDDIEVAANRQQQRGVRKQLDMAS